jgi:bifunctional DNA-binding transcriptional regulator/antitoxin component of YhaV-PrlF toxin-antitoxin module
MAAARVPIETRVTDANQTQVPAVIRELHHVGPGDVVVWEVLPSGDVRVRFRPRRRLRDLVGIAPNLPYDSVTAKKKAQRGER